MTNRHTMAEHLAALDTALAELRNELESQGEDEDAIFLRLGTALHWVYAASELDRKRFEAGAVGGLRWVRGKSTHAGAVIRELRPMEVPIKVRVDNQWVDATRKIRVDGDWLPAKTMVFQLVWKDADALGGRAGEAGGEPYKEHVAGRRLIVPLELARAQLAERATSD